MQHKCNCFLVQPEKLTVCALLIPPIAKQNIILLFPECGLPNFSSFCDFYEL